MFLMGPTVDQLATELGNRQISIVTAMLMLQRRGCYNDVGVTAMWVSQRCNRNIVCQCTLKRNKGGSRYSVYILQHPPAHTAPARASESNSNPCSSCSSGSSSKLWLEFSRFQIQLALASSSSWLG